MVASGPPWMNTAREIAARGSTELAAYETIHIAHILEQLVRGYLCGSNTQQWHEHVFTVMTINLIVQIPTLIIIGLSSNKEELYTYICWYG